MRFDVELPLPPLYNHAVVHTSAGHYPSAQYRAWLGIAYDLIRDALLEHEGCTFPVECCCRVEVRLHMGTTRRGDVDGYLKPILDALGGARPSPRRIERSGLVYVDDRQVVSASIRVASLGNSEGVAVVRVTTVEPPENRREKRRRT